MKVLKYVRALHPCPSGMPHECWAVFEDGRRIGVVYQVGREDQWYMCQDGYRAIKDPSSPYPDRAGAVRVLLTLDEIVHYPNDNRKGM